MKVDNGFVFIPYYSFGQHDDNLLILQVVIIIMLTLDLKQLKFPLKPAITLQHQMYVDLARVSRNLGG